MPGAWAGLRSSHSAICDNLRLVAGGGVPAAWLEVRHNLPRPTGKHGCEDLPALPKEANTPTCAIRGIFLLMNVGWGGGEELEREVGVCMSVVRLDDGMHDGVIGVVASGACAIDVRFEGKKKDWLLILGGRREIKRVVVVVVVMCGLGRGIKESSKEL
ncbi:uncharacterized protein [Triticum aestivum]|uniref:uncharacterized protein n=1 Tax=Triticum aestivum TaxID=4565 RepID=UPI001D01F388|nr:uncharacterized protein LOC123168929 [Triticum aestivum]XP_044442729.1 uncharacterized protein LOC123168929 [Triticum aestivum]